MGRKKKDRRMSDATTAIAEAMQEPSFRRELHKLHDILKRFQQKRQEAMEQDPGAALLNEGWKETRILDGETWYSGVHYELREVCDAYRLPWPESAQLLVAALLNSPASMEEPPLPDAWRAWRMARSGLGKPKPDEIAAAKEKLGKYTPSGRRRRFTGGLTQEAVAYLLEVDDRTVRHYIAECKCHIEGKSAARIVEVAALPINLWRAVQEYLSQQGGRPEE